MWPFFQNDTIQTQNKNVREIEIVKGGEKRETGGLPADYFPFIQFNKWLRSCPVYTSQKPTAVSQFQETLQISLPVLEIL